MNDNNQVVFEGKPPFLLRGVQIAEAICEPDSSVRITVKGSLEGREKYGLEDVLFVLSAQAAREFSASLNGAAEEALNKLRSL